MRLKRLAALLRNVARLWPVFALLTAFTITAFAQDDDNAVAGDYVQTSLQIARELIEEERGSRLTMVRWRYYEDNWSSTGSYQLYGSFGIDNCTVDVPIAQKRGEIRFGWTFSLMDISGKEYQARVSYDFNDSILCDDVRVPPAYASTAPEVSSEPEQQVASVSTEGPEGFVLGGHVAGLDGRAAELMRSAGMTWVKTQLPVKAGVAKGIEFIRGAKANNFKLLLGVVGDKEALANDFDGYVAQLAAFVAELARNGADAIEVWNEPNLDREWPHGQIHGTKYVKMLKAAYSAIKAANGATLVISGAPAPTGAAALFPGAVVNDDNFMRQMAQAGAAQYMDCLGLHYNEGILSPRRSSGDPRNPYPTRYFGSMLNRGAQFFPNSKICWTELGYLSGEGMGAPIPASFAWASNVTVAQQAEWIADAARLSRESGRVSLMIVWNVNFTRWDTDPMGGYALLRPDGSCPGCATLGAAMSESA